MPRFDFSNTDDFPLLDEGEHIVKVDNVYEQDSKKNGRPMVVFEFVAKSGERLFHYCMNEETNRWMLKKTLSAILGQELPKGPVDVDFEDLIGRRLKVLVWHDNYEGQKRAKVKDIIKGDQVSPGQTKVEDFTESLDEVPFD